MILKNQNGKRRKSFNKDMKHCRRGFMKEWMFIKKNQLMLMSRKMGMERQGWGKLEGFSLGTLSLMHVNL